MIKRYKTTTSKRKVRIRSKIKAAKRLRLSVQRSNTQIYAQIIDDQKGTTLVSSNSLQLKEKFTNKIEQAKIVGTDLAKKAVSKKISKIVFDRGQYKFHGRVKALADAARTAGLDF